MANYYIYRVPLKGVFGHCPAPQAAAGEGPCDLTKLRVSDVTHGGRVMARAMYKGGLTVRGSTQPHRRHCTRISPQTYPVGCYLIRAKRLSKLPALRSCNRSACLARRQMSCFGSYFCLLCLVLSWKCREQHASLSTSRKKYLAKAPVGQPRWLCSVVD